VLIFKPPGCRRLKHNELLHHLKERAYFYSNDDYEPDLWIQDNTRVYEGGCHRWKPLLEINRDDPLTTLIGVIDNPTTKSREYMVAAVKDSRREIPVAFGSSYGKVNRGGLTNFQMSHGELSHAANLLVHPSVPI
jgi:hypothetical protein